MGINFCNDKDFNCVKNSPVYSDWIHVSFISKSLKYICGFFKSKRRDSNFLKFILSFNFPQNFFYPL